MTRHLVGRRSLYCFSRAALAQKTQTHSFPMSNQAIVNGVKSDTVKVDLSDLRKEYHVVTSNGPNEFESVGYLDPIRKFEEWFSEAKEKCHTYEEANAVALSTCTREGRPSCRMVLLKAFGTSGFKFFTNYESRKALEIAENPSVSMLCYWPTLNRQVRIEGRVEKLSDAESLEYWNKRPPKSQASAFASAQSRPMKCRKEIEDKIAQINREFVDKSEPIPKPSNWGGYILIPDDMEFWEGRECRQHDRIRFRKKTSLDEQTFESGLFREAENGWFYQHLQP
uniref:Pyridoxine-5'-phosphate oxidase n=1 Tax=Romanomermis culicivorax TaxID=13658 RepID=A0A915K4M1_ROMCU